MWGIYQYFTIAINGAQPLKIMTHYIVPVTCIILYSNNTLVKKIS